MSNDFAVPNFGECLHFGQKPLLNGSERLLIGYSVRNRNFSKSWFSSLTHLAKTCFQKSRVIIVDEPYAYNDAAENDRDEPNTSEISRAIKIGDERAQMVRKAIKGSEIEVTRWNWYAHNPFVTELTKEIKTAIKDKNAVYNILRKYTEEWIRGPLPNEKYINFLAMEIPVFSYLYWMENFTVDIYPGKPLELFLHLQEGSLQDELPKLHDLSRHHQISFIDTCPRRPQI